jgi:hypothetical protein
MVRIITLACPSCGTVVAGNVLEDHREMKCPGLGCESVLRFSDLPADEQQHITDNPEQYAMVE